MTQSYDFNYNVCMHGQWNQVLVHTAQMTNVPRTMRQKVANLVLLTVILFLQIKAWCCSL